MFLLTWDDWGGLRRSRFHSRTFEHTPDGVQLAYDGRGSRAADVRPAPVTPGIDSRRCSRCQPAQNCAAICWALSSPARPRVDTDLWLADLVATCPTHPRHRPLSAPPSPDPSHRRRPRRPNRRRRQAAPAPRSGPCSCATAPPCRHPTTCRSHRNTPHTPPEPANTEPPVTSYGSTNNTAAANMPMATGWQR